MATPVAQRSELVGILAEELTNVRRRGLDALDVTSRRKQPLPLPELDRLARQHAGDPELPRQLLVRQLLTDALDAWARQDGGRHADDAAFARELLIGDPQATAADRQPTRLKQQVMLARGLTEDTLDDRRQAVFGSSPASWPTSALRRGRSRGGSRRPGRGRWLPSCWRLP